MTDKQQPSGKRRGSPFPGFFSRGDLMGQQYAPAKAAICCQRSPVIHCHAIRCMAAAGDIGGYGSNPA
jgi:hypothetical protein